MIRTEVNGSKVRYTGPLYDGALFITCIVNLFITVWGIEQREIPPTPSLHISRIEMLYSMGLMKLAKLMERK